MKLRKTMKKKIICSAAAAAMCLFSFGYIAECAAEDAAAPAAQAAEEQFKDGEDYFTINAEKTAQPEIKEFFSPYCSHCMAFEDITARLRKDEPKAAFVRSPVAFMGGDMAAEMQKAVAVAQQLDVTDKFVSLAFDQIQKQRQEPKSHNDVVKMFEYIGVKAEDCEKAYGGFSTPGMVSNYNTDFDRTGADGVPCFVINGKYRINNAKLKSYDDLKKITDYLLAK